MVDASFGVFWGIAAGDDDALFMLGETSGLGVGSGEFILAVGDAGGVSCRVTVLV